MSSTTVTAPPQENGHHDNHLKRALQSKFAMANEESAAAAQGEAWQTRDARLPVVLLPPPTDVAILRRYAVEAEKQNLGEHFSQVNQAFRILFFGMDSFLIHSTNSTRVDIFMALIFSFSFLH